MPGAVALRLRLVRSARQVVALTALGVNPSSIATPFGVFPGCWQSRTTSALYSSVKLRRLRFFFDMSSGRILPHWRCPRKRGRATSPSDKAFYSYAVAVKDWVQFPLSAVAPATWDSFWRAAYQKANAGIQRQANMLLKRGSITI
jgi:hypothetical protein